MNIVNNKTDAEYNLMKYVAHLEQLHNFVHRCETSQ